MSLLTWKIELGDLAEFFPCENSENTELSVTLRRFHIAWLSECRSEVTLVRSPYANRAEHDLEVADLWSECAFALRYLAVTSDPSSAAALVAKQLINVLPCHRTDAVSLYKVSMLLNRFSRTLRKDLELSTLIGASAHSLNAYFFTLQGLTGSSQRSKIVDQAA
jgi:hypothetical protein